MTMIWFRIVGVRRPSDDQIPAHSENCRDQPVSLHRDIERIVNVVLKEIVEALARGDWVELRDFGAFTVRHRAPRIGRNPRTGAAVSVAGSSCRSSRNGKDLRERLNGNKHH